MDPIILQAQLDAAEQALRDEERRNAVLVRELAELRIKEIEITGSRSTVPSPPPDETATEQSDTGRAQESYRLGRAIVGLDAVNSFISGAVKGEAAEVANYLGGVLRARQDDFEREVLKRLANIQRTLDMALANFRDQTEELGRVKRQNTRLLSLIPGGTSEDDPLAAAAQEAE